MKENTPSCQLKPPGSDRGTTGALSTKRTFYSSSTEVSPLRPDYHHFPVLGKGIDPPPEQVTWATPNGARAPAKLDVAKEWGRVRSHLAALREIGAASMSGPFCSVKGRATPDGVECGRHKIYGLTFLFSRKRVGLERHLVAKYVTNTEPRGRPPYWGLSMEGQHKDTV